MSNGDGLEESQVRPTSKIWCIMDHYSSLKNGCLTFSMRAYDMLKYPLNGVPAEAHFSGYFINQ